MRRRGTSGHERRDPTAVLRPEVDPWRPYIPENPLEDATQFRLLPTVNVRAQIELLLVIVQVQVVLPQDERPALPVERRQPAESAPAVLPVEPAGTSGHRGDTTASRRGGGLQAPR
ncbi:hypothetical protein DL768_002102 [Monosporascus sp. mg162]|nr:hypothetical protein DL768_002102 [Monosporascus sp. mg162]